MWRCGVASGTSSQSRVVNGRDRGGGWVVGRGRGGSARVTDNVSKFGGSLKFGRWRIRQIFKKSVKFVKKQKKLAETKLSRERNRKNLETQNSAGLTELSTGLSELSAGFPKMGFPKNSVIFEKHFGSLKRFE
jgi:hypothetical protein